MPPASTPPRRAPGRSPGRIIRTGSFSGQPSRGCKIFHGLRPPVVAAHGVSCLAVSAMEPESVNAPCRRHGRTAPPSGPMPTCGFGAPAGAASPKRPTARPFGCNRSVPRGRKTAPVRQLLGAVIKLPPPPNRGSFPPVSRDAATHAQIVAPAPRRRARPARRAHPRRSCGSPRASGPAGARGGIRLSGQPRAPPCAGGRPCRGSGAA